MTTNNDGPLSTIRSELEAIRKLASESESAALREIEYHAEDALVALGCVDQPSWSDTLTELRNFIVGECLTDVAMSLLFAEEDKGKSLSHSSVVQADLIAHLLKQFEQRVNKFLGDAGTDCRPELIKLHVREWLVFSDLIEGIAVELERRAIAAEPEASSTEVSQ